MKSYFLFNLSCSTLASLIGSIKRTFGRVEVEYNAIKDIALDNGEIDELRDEGKDDADEGRSKRGRAERVVERERSIVCLRIQPKRVLSQRGRERDKKNRRKGNKLRTGSGSPDGSLTS